MAPEPLLNPAGLEYINAREELFARTDPRPPSRSASSDSFEMVEAEAPEAAGSNSGGGDGDETEQEATRRIAQRNHCVKLGDYDRAIELSRAGAQCRHSQP
eukprot:scaffold46848_cov64-Phaeocystis_antarctica.AAC.3